LAVAQGYALDIEKPHKSPKPLGWTFPTSSGSNPTRRINELRSITRDPEVLLLRCRRGHVHGVANEVAPCAGFRFVCSCPDCQAFAHFLEWPDVLDIAGGTDIFHVPTGRVKLTACTDAVRCLHFSSKVFRWYTDCCRTPMATPPPSSYGRACRAWQPQVHLPRRRTIAGTA
jgi:hypothetical protein